MVGRQEELRRDLARLQAQLRGATGGGPIRGFLDGLFGGLLLGAALTLFAVRRTTVVEAESPREASIELKERATRLVQNVRDGAAALGE